ncbi:MAG TPA: hypothetical protein VKS44_13285 [Candidatus Acidoferrales bacterium]|nr:hypothetical protein [Candidatus Acidoferrales bacterium]
MMRQAQQILVLGSLALLGAGGCFARDQQAAKASPEDVAGFKEFSANVQRYVDLHKRLEKSLPKLKNNASPELIASHQQALAKKIQAARGNARDHDIFVPKAAKAFRDAIDREFQGSLARNARATIQQGDPLKDVQVEVNQIYPRGLAYTSVPPTLLLKFPKLPEELAYRIVDHDLLILDLKANLVVDVLREVLP